MSAINIHIGTQAPEDRQDQSCDVSFGAEARVCTPPIEQQHVGQTRMLWVRQALTDWSVGIQYQIILKNGSLGFEITPKFHADLFPWLYDKSGSKGQTFFSLIGEAAKMGCPTWDLPAGSPHLGGTCPGATWGQSTVPIGVREARGIKAVGQPVKLRETICQMCYAEGGNYSTFAIQLGELLHYWWTRELLMTGRTDEWIATMVEAISRARFPVERHPDPRDPSRPLMPMRVHSSGDFFSPDYAAAWIKIANQMSHVTFWAPTRTWAASSGWVNFWRKSTPTIEHSNLIVRPSAYMTDDPAPSTGGRMIPCETGRDSSNPHVEMRPETPWGIDPEDPRYPFNAQGTTAVYKFNDQNWHGHVSIEDIIKHGSKDPRYDWQCGTYAIMNNEDSCYNAMAPDGKKTCRACWIRPELRVNYTVH